MEGGREGGKEGRSGGEKRLNKQIISQPSFYSYEGREKKSMVE